MARDQWFKVRLSAEELGSWQAAAAKRGIDASELVREAVAAYLDGDQHDELADLGRGVLALVRKQFARR